MEVDLLNHLKALKAQRAIVKRALTCYENFLNKMSATSDIHPLEHRYKDIQKTFETFNQIQNEIEAIVVNPEEEVEVRNDFTDRYYNTFSIADKFLSHKTNNQNSTQALSESSCRQTLDAPISISNLPKVNLPTFNGAYDSWLGFHDLFHTFIDSDPKIPSIQKFVYLKGCLIGEAAAVIDSIELASDNYQVAWALLKKRYDNKRLIRQKHAKALLDLPNISKENPIRPFVDKLQKHLRALEALGEPVDSWGTILIAVVLDKLNHFLREKWEEFTVDYTHPTWDHMMAFLQRRAQLNDVQPFQPPTKLPTASKSFTRHPPQRAFTTTATKLTCPYCNGEHNIMSCAKFESLSPGERYEAAKKSLLCLNCLRKNHRRDKCLAGTCRRCNQKHHTLLHFEKQNFNHISQEPTETKPESPNPRTSINMHTKVSSEVILATAIVDIFNNQGITKSCRVFLDAGSQAHFISEKLATFLKLPKRSVDISVTGVEGIATEVKHSVSVTLKSRVNNFQRVLDCLVVSNITENLPSITIDPSRLNIPNNIVLADPDFHKPSDVDLLIGVKLFYRLLCVGQIALKNQPDAVLQKTHLGWIVAGEVNSSASLTSLTFTRNKTSCHLAIQPRSLDSELTKFWEIEEIPAKKSLSPEEKACETHFVINTRRDTEGRYVVRLPFIEKKDQIGESYSMALKRFRSLENRFNRDPNLKKEYVDFVKEYRKLNHMSPCQDETEKGECFYLPHHAVIKADSLTTKTRVVFDGSAKSSSGVSLNDALMIGPKLQDDLFVLLTRFRSHTFALTADIAKMYRQVKIDPIDTPFQKIIFRYNPTEPLQQYTLDTVTYGTSCASFLAIRTLYQLADDEGYQHPVAAAVLKRDFYVDDLLTGANTRREAEDLRDDLIILLKKGGFDLRKWASNDPTLISHQSEHPNNTHMSLDPDSTVKTLGIQWNSRDDFIFYAVRLPENSQPITKRSILSQVAKLFDPLGLLGPVVVQAKILIQQLWKAGMSWDESVPHQIHTSWSGYRSELPSLSQIRFDRLMISPEASQIELHGFCDASEKAYGACLYIRSVDKHGQAHSRLVCSKSRVAPVRPVTLPRLELCAAVLLSRLYNRVRQSLQMDLGKIHLWSDSTITLNWIKTEPHRLKTFVSNRVTEIQDLTQTCTWHYVPSLDNPADLISRGQSPLEFSKPSIWREGPQWLLLSEPFWPHEPVRSVEIPEMRSTNLPVINMKLTIVNQNLLEKYSNTRKLKRVVGYVLRFIHNCKNPEVRIRGPLSEPELSKSLEIIIKIYQSLTFSKEINALKCNEHIPNQSRLIPLAPFLDGQGILRLGGRLQFSNLSEGQKHPYLLAPGYITNLLIREEHERLKHAGIQATLYSIRERFWPINGRNITRKIVRNCRICFRARPRGSDYIMGSLPVQRVSLSRPFLHVGVDYCGPFFIKEKRIRNRGKVKVYVSIFVCMSTKAVHLELVSDLTTES